MPNERPQPHNYYKITYEIVEHFTKQVDGKQKAYVRGRASGLAVDHDTERCAKSAIESIRNAIYEGKTLPDGRWSLIPLQAAHRLGWLGDTLGYIVEAEIDDNYDIFIVAELDLDNPDAQLLWTKLHKPEEKGKPVQLGLSIGGLVLSAGQEWDATRECFVKVFYKLSIDEVSVVSRPAYPTAYLTALGKSVDWSIVRGKTSLDSEDYMSKIQTPNDEVDAIAKEDTLEAVAVDTADSAATEVTKAEEVIEEAEVTKTQTADDATTDSVAKTEVITDVQDIVKEVSTDSSDELRKQLTDVMQSLVTLTQVVNTLVEKSDKTAEVVTEAEAVVEEVVKQVADEATDAAETVTKADAVEVVTDVVEKAATLSVDDIASVLKTVLAEELGKLTKRMDEIEAMPIDKSLAVETQKHDGRRIIDADQIMKEVSEQTAGMTPKASLFAAIDRAVTG